MYAWIGVLITMETDGRWGAFLSFTRAHEQEGSEGVAAIVATCDFNPSASHGTYVSVSISLCVCGIDTNGQGHYEDNSNNP